jgi:hypothetical protein
VVVGRREIDPARLERHLVLGFDDDQPCVILEHLPKAVALRTHRAVLDNDERHAKPFRQGREEPRQRVQAAERRADGYQFGPFHAIRL